MLVYCLQLRNLCVTKRMDECLLNLACPALLLSATITRLHTSHVIIKVLASMDEPKSRELYNKLRAVYNPLRHPSFPIVPPLEEWHDGSVSCDNFYCRYFRLYSL